MSSLPSRYDLDLGDEELSDEILNFISPERAARASGATARGKIWFENNKER